MIARGRNLGRTERRSDRARRDGRDPPLPCRPWQPRRCAAARSTPRASRARCAWARSCGAASGRLVYAASVEQLATKIDQIMMSSAELARQDAVRRRSPSPAACWQTRRWRCSSSVARLRRRLADTDARHPCRQDRAGRGDRAVRQPGRLRQRHRLRHQFRLRPARAVDGYDLSVLHHQATARSPARPCTMPPMRSSSRPKRSTARAVLDRRLRGCCAAARRMPHASIARSVRGGRASRSASCSGRSGSCRSAANGSGCGSRRSGTACRARSGLHDLDHRRADSSWCCRTGSSG